MRLRVRADLWATSLFMALGLLPIAACGGSSDGDATNPFPCEGAQESEAGYAACDNGVTIRQSVVACPSTLPRSEPQTTSTTGECTYDADCTERPNGYCATSVYLGGDSNTLCIYGCVTDADCGTGHICVCGDPVGHCAPATCTSDADCAPGFHCASYDPSGGCDFVAFACQKPADECAVSADCGQGLLCNLNKEGTARVCTQGGCAIGRPFLVDDVARVAATERRSDWLAGDLAPDLVRLTPDLRRLLAEQWTRAAQLEHASIAAFSRFLLELMALGAPAELVARTISAMEDERRHAQLCFALASEYAGDVIGPGALDVRGALEAPSLERSLATALEEGCIGETVAALEAAELAARVADPLLRLVLERIAADERRHSELAFRFVQWALSQDARLAGVLERELLRVRDELDRHEPQTIGPRAHGLARAGVLPEALRTSLRDAALRRIVEPALAGMIEHCRGSSRNAA